MSTARAIVYKTKPNFEHKAARELEQHNINAVVPFDDTGKRRKTTVPGYVFAGRALQAVFVKHVGKAVGTTPIDAIARLYLFKQRSAPRADNPFKAGDKAIKGEIAVIVISTSGRTCRVRWTMLGKTHTQSIHYTQLRPG
jgi:hypothetical protein